MINEIEKKYIYILFGITIIILIIVLGFIWAPMFKDKELVKEINYFALPQNSEYYVEKMKEEYKKVIFDAINVDKFDETINKIDTEYLNKLEMNNEELKEYLTTSNILNHPSSSTIVYNTQVRTDGKKYVYSYNYKIGDNIKKIHIIENYYGNYSISFAQESYPVLTLEEFDTFDEFGNEYKVKYNACYENNLVLDITIINNTTEEYTYDFNGNQASFVIYDGNVRRGLANVIVGQEYSTIRTEPGSTSKIKLTYDVELLKQDSIQAIEFNDVTTSNGDKVKVKFDLK